MYNVQNMVLYDNAIIKTTIFRELYNVHVAKLSSMLYAFCDIQGSSCVIAPRLVGVNLLAHWHLQLVVWPPILCDMRYMRSFGFYVGEEALILSCCQAMTNSFVLSATSFKCLVCSSSFYPFLVCWLYEIWAYAAIVKLLLHNSK